jgi:thioesterase domain-containing protein
LNASGARPPLFYLHGDLFAQGLYARKLAAAIGSDQPVFSIAPHGTEGLPLLTTVESMARDYVERIRRIQPHGPYRLGGFCASGLVAYEIACILRAAGETVDAVLLLNSSPLPNERIAALDWLVRRIGSDARLSSRVRDSLCYNLARVHAALVTGPVATVSVLRRLLSASVRRSRTNVDPLEPEHFEQRRGAEDTKNSFAHIVAALTYHPRRYAGDVTLIWGEEQATIFEERTMGWGAVAEHVTIVSMRGGHVGSLSGRVEELAGAFHTALAGVTSPC